MSQGGTTLREAFENAAVAMTDYISDLSKVEEGDDCVHITADGELSLCFFYFRFLLSLSLSFLVFYPTFWVQNRSQELHCYLHLS